MPRGGHDIPVSGTHLKGTQWLRRVDPTVGHLKGTPWSRRVWTPHVDSIIRQLGSTFSTKDLGPLSYFYGVEVLATSSGLFLSQQNYVIDLLSKHNMLDSKPISTPLVIGTSLTANDGTAPVNATMYCQVIDGLQHLHMTRLNISFVVNNLS